LSKPRWTADVEESEDEAEAEAGAMPLAATLPKAEKGTWQFTDSGLLQEKRTEIVAALGKQTGTTVHQEKPGAGMGCRSHQAAGQHNLQAISRKSDSLPTGSPTIHNGTPFCWKGRKRILSWAAWICPSPLRCPSPS